jgi:hypothetical protein
MNDIATILKWVTVSAKISDGIIAMVNSIIDAQSGHKSREDAQLAISAIDKNIADAVAEEHALFSDTDLGSP